MNPPYEQNLERDAKLVAAGFRGTLKFFEVAKAMGLWTTPQEAINYSRNIREQPQEYRLKVGKMASQLLAIADAAAPKKKPVGRLM